MPLDNHIDAGAGVVIATSGSTLTVDDIVEYLEALRADPHHTAGLNEFMDLRSVEDLKVTTEGLRSLVALNRRYEKECSTAKCAIVGSAALVFGMPRTYEILSDDDPFPVDVFRDMNEARAWLGLPL